MSEFHTIQTPAEGKRPCVNKFYFAAWRWHFYAGLFVLPFLFILAVTGMLMMWIAFIDGRDGEKTAITPLGRTMPLSAQRDVALSAVPDGVFRQYIAPRNEGLAAIFRIDQGDEAMMVTVNPYTAKSLEVLPRRQGWYDVFDSIHSDLMLGVIGDRLLEAAASLALLLVITGLYLWWPRQGQGQSRRERWKKVIIPQLTRGRSLWKSLHGVVGFWASIFLVVFLISGLAWAGIWGGKFVQAWSQFPAQKWLNIPLSDLTHASLNHERKEVPWALEQTPLPASIKEGSASREVNIDSISHHARVIGFQGRYQLNPPRGAQGVWTVSQDSMSTDSENPTADRTVHIDQYTGKVLADVRFEDYSLAGKAMAVGIALHMGTLGLWSVLANSLVCMFVMFLCASALALWWLRRPLGCKGLCPPPMPKEMPLWRGALVIGLLVSMAFPMAGMTLIVALLFDLIVLSTLQKMISKV